MKTTICRERRPRRSVERIVSIILSICMLLSLTAGLDFSAYALSSSGSCGTNVTYTFDSSTGTLTISGTGAMTDYFNSSSPFFEQSSINKVIIKSGVTSIGDNAFFYCKNLASVTIGNSVTSVGFGAFSRCTGLTSITIPDSITSISFVAFAGCSSLTSITIPDSVTNIGGSAFEGCTGLTSITIPNSVTSIGDYAFEGCTGLTSVTIPDSVTSIGNSPFRSCFRLTSVTVGGNNVNYSSQDGVLFNKKKTALIQYPAGNSRTSYTIPDCVTSIGDAAFSGCTGLTSIIIPDGVTSIGDDAFFNCSSLTNIAIPDSVTSIGSGAFGECSKLTSITIPNGVTSIRDSAFYGCKSIRNITIPDNVTSIGSSAFYYCSSLTSITIPDGVTSIGASAFSGCTGLTSIIIPDGVTSIGDDAFYGTEYYNNESNWENNVLYIGKHLIKAKTISGCYIIRTGIKTIAGTAFRDCTYLTSITIPNSVTSIGRSAFNGCTGLTSITIPDSVTSIGSYAFGNCTGLTRVNISDLKSWCEITFSNYLSNPLYYAHNLYLNNSLLTSITIPDSVTSIGNYTFDSCSSLTSITIPDGVTNIGGSAFSGCTDLKDVYYNGSEAEWNKISIGEDNDDLINATIHYNSETPELIEVLSGGKYGDFFVNGNAIVGEHSAISTYINSAWFYENSNTYNHEMAKLCAVMDLEGYQTKADVKAALKSLGFSVRDKDIQLGTDRDEVNYFIAYLPITNGSKEYNLVFMGLIGSHKLQWNSNFDPAGKDSSKSGYNTSTQVHLGFKDAKDFAETKLIEYIKEKEFTKNNTKILLTGHSRGAAAANLLAADLIYANSENSAASPVVGPVGIVSPENLFTYTFATPNNTKDKNRNNSEYKRIFNIVFPNDLVPHLLPVAWKFGKYGTTYTIPTKTSNPKKYSDYVNNMMPYYWDFNTNTIKNPEQDWLQRIKFEDFKVESKSARAVNVLTKKVKSINSFYNNKYTCGKASVNPGWSTATITRYITPFNYFQQALCPFVNHVDEENLGLMLAPLTDALSPYQGISAYFALHNNQVFTQKFEDAHKMETYAAFMYSLSESVLIKDKNHKLNCVNCPVDIEVYDKDTNELVGRIVNNIVDEKIDGKDNSIDMYVEGDEKCFCIPDDGDYKVKLIGNDNGKMDYTVADIDSDLGETARSNFFNIELVEGEAYTGDFTSENFSLTDYSLEDKNGNTVTSDEHFSADEVKEYAIDISTEGSGTVTGDMTVVSGDYAVLSANPICSDFLGWYSNNKLITKETNYRFRPTESIILTAKFTAATHHKFNKIVIAPNCTVKGYTAYECEVCGYSYNGNFKNATAHKPVADKAVPATFVSAGKTAGTHCSVCGKIIVAQKPVAMLGAAKLSKVKKGKKSFTATWKPVANVDGYEIQYSLKKNMKKAKTKSVASSKKKLKVKKLKAKKKYYVRIRAYKVINGKKQYSAWSAKKKVKTK